MSGQFENILPANADTILSISSFGNMLYQARGLTQTLSVIGEATQQERTINGTLVDISAAQFRKYSSKINSPNDVNAPPLDGVFPGMVVTVQCAVGLAYLTSGGNGPHHRPEVSGSTYTDGAYTFYRPELTMMVKTVETQFDEWKNVVGWSIELEEV
jgi:Neuraminidase (sialidase)